MVHQISYVADSKNVLSRKSKSFCDYCNISGESFRKMSTIKSMTRRMKGEIIVADIVPCRRSFLRANLHTLLQRRLSAVVCKCHQLQFLNHCRCAAADNPGLSAD
jgi:hypothetical protein